MGRAQHIKRGKKNPAFFFSCKCGIAQFLRTAEESEREQTFSSKQNIILKSMLNTKNERKLFSCFISQEGQGQSLGGRRDSN